MYLFALVAFGAAAYFVAMALRQPRLAAIVAAILWLCYGAYETQIARGVLCDANCNIRVDLLLFWPVLLVVTLIARNAAAPSKTALKILGVVILALAVQAAVMFGYIALFDPPEAPPGATQSDSGSASKPKATPSAK